MTLPDGDSNRMFQLWFDLGYTHLGRIDVVQPIPRTVMDSFLLTFVITTRFLILTMEENRFGAICLLLLALIYLLSIAIKQSK